MRDQVGLICVIGEKCQLVEDIIDELVVGDGSDQGRFILTSSHKDETIQEVMEFIQTCADIDGDVSQVKLS